MTDLAAIRYLEANDVCSWNQWRRANRGVHVDLRNASFDSAELDHADFIDVGFSGASFSSSNLRNACFREVDLQKANFERANLCRADFISATLTDTRFAKAHLIEAYFLSANCNGADFSDAHLRDANFGDANLTGANFRSAYLGSVNLNGANLSGAILQQTSLYEADLRRANLRGADLSGANLSGANLSNAVLEGADLSGAILQETNMLRADLSGAVLTGACLEDWNISRSTNIKEVKADYVYLRSSWNEQLNTIEFSTRRPESGNFKPGEFSILFQRSFDTVDLIFTDGIDWKAFFASFQKLRQEYDDTNLHIQSIERKSEGAFTVRLEVSKNADRIAIERFAKTEYGNQLRLIESHWKEQLRLQGKHLEDIRSVLAAERQERATMIGVISSMANSQQGPKYDLRGAQFAGGMAETVQGNQFGGTINNYGAKIEDITQLLSTLRKQAREFPDEYKADALDTIDDLEIDIKKTAPDQNKIGRRLKQLVAVASAIGAIAGTTATFSDDMNEITSNVTEFTSNVIELTEVLELPIELVQPVKPNLADK